MSTLVTDAFGCIGSWVVRGLLARGERPIAFDLGNDPWRMRKREGELHGVLRMPRPAKLLVDHCALHPGMKGQIEVKESGAARLE